MIALTMDAGLCILTVWVAFYLRLGEFIALSGGEAPAAIVSPLLALPILSAFGLYRAVFRFSGQEAIVATSQAMAVYGIAYSAIFTAFGISGVPRTIGLIQPMLLFLTIAVTRALASYLLGGRYRQLLQNSLRKNVLIYGAGSTGRQLAAALAESRQFRPVGFIDDDVSLQHAHVAGLSVVGSDKLASVVEQRSVQEIYLAIPSASRARRNEILASLQTLSVEVRTLPGLLEIAAGKVTVSNLRPLELDDLLGRESVDADHELVAQHVAGRTVLVTGAGGSIGSELCRQILTYHPKRLLLVDTSEFALYSIHQQLEATRVVEGSEVELVPFLTSAADEAGMRRLFRLWRPEVAYHAAAYKHVPLVEHNVVEGMRNNVLGTWVCAKLAKEFGTARFVLVSTDKAVRPTNVMGASKRFAELGLQALAGENPRTCFTMVRFGNVLGSSGSVVPLFRKQILDGGPLTVTHKEVTRFFMSVPEAAQLVLSAGAMASGGEVFILDMGDPVRIYDLAVKLIELSGLRLRDAAHPDGDIEISFTGLRPGEKLYEELLIGENPVATEHPRVMKAQEPFLPLADYEHQIGRLKLLLGNHDVTGLREQLSELVAGFDGEHEVVDWAFVEQQRHDGTAGVIPFRGR